MVGCNWLTDSLGKILPKCQETRAKNLFFQGTQNGSEMAGFGYKKAEAVRDFRIIQFLF